MRRGLQRRLWARDTGFRSEAPPQLHRVPTDGGSPRLVFLHGLGATHRYWTCATLPVEGAAYVDLLGFGNSPRPLVRYTPGRHLSALRATLASAKRFVLVGHSLGAALALAYAVRYPDDVEALLLLSLPHFGGHTAAFRWMRRRPRGWLWTNMLVTAVACVLGRRILGPLLPRLLPRLPREVAEDLVKHNFMASTTSLWEVLYRRDLEVDAAALPDRIPVQLIHGAEDETAPLDGVGSLASSRPGWRLDVLPGCGHHPWLRSHEICRSLLDGIAGFQ